MTHEDDYLEAAKFTLEASRREGSLEAKAKGPGGSIFTADQLINVGTLEALIAIAEQMRPQVARLPQAPDPTAATAYNDDLS